MISKWLHIKPEAIALRKRGKSIRHVSTFLGIPLSTLSYWFRNIELTKSQKAVLKRKYDKALIKARVNAVKWHNQQKFERLKTAEMEADRVLSLIRNKNEILELTLAILYLAEGSRKTPTTSMGNSDPLILKFFLKILLTIYNIKIEKISFYLHLRSDQNPEKLKRFWAKELGVPLIRFGKVSIDKRTIKNATYSHYKGVCVVHCGNVAIQRKLGYIGRKFCEKVVENTRD